MKVKVLAVAILLGILSSPLALAQGPPPDPWRPPSCPPGPAPPSEEEPLSTCLSPGEQDEFGYSYTEVALDWIDATQGTATDIDSSAGRAVVDLDIPFPFCYYENTYERVWVSASGYLAFTEAADWPNRIEDLPDPAVPNNIVAPYGTMLYADASGAEGRVYCLGGGVAPNRYFVIEWHRVLNGATRQTFEVVLHEQGDITYQYLDMDCSSCSSPNRIGIEDATGRVGLCYYPPYPISHQAWRFHRPPPQARVKATPASQRRLVYSGSAATFDITVLNSGDLGPDRYNLQIESSHWPVSASLDGHPLSDSDGDGYVDTGPLAPGQCATLTLSAQTPAIVNVDDSTSVVLHLQSALDSTVQTTCTLEASVPPPFAQIFRDGSPTGALSLQLTQPIAQSIRKITPDGYRAGSMAVAETADGFVCVWSASQEGGGEECFHIEYALLDRDGWITPRGITRLTDHTGATAQVYDDPVVATAPDGRIAILWHRYTLRSSDSWWLSNTFYAVLMSGGDILVPPTGLTNHTTGGCG